jgi:hypothetical protein
MVIEVEMSDNEALTGAFVSLLAAKGLNGAGDAPRIVVLAWGVYALNVYTGGAVGSVSAELNRYPATKTLDAGDPASMIAYDPDHLHDMDIADYIETVEEPGTGITFGGSGAVELLKSVNIPPDGVYEMGFPAGQRPILTVGEVVAITMKKQTSDGDVSGRGFLRLGVE